MAIVPKPEQADVPVLVGRRSTRLSVAVPITVTGTDAAGNDFRENTFTLNVNKHGAEIATSRALGASAEVTIENATLGRKARARVVLRRERRTPNSPYEVSLELLDPENIWGVRFPPADWEKDFSPKTNGTSARADAQPAPAAPAVNNSKSQVVQPGPVPLPAAPEEADLRPSALAEPADLAAESAHEPEKLELQSVEETAVEMAAPLLAVKSEPEAEPAVEEPANSPEQPMAETVAVTESRATAPELAAIEKTTQAARDAEARLESLTTRLEAATAQLESLLSKAGEARANLQSELDRVRSDIQHAGQQAARSAVEEFRGKLSAEWVAASAPLLDDTRRRLKEDVSAAVAAFGKESGAHLARLTQESGPELEAKQKQAVNGAKEQIAHAAEASVSEFNASLGKLAKETSASLHSRMQASLDKALADSTGRLAQSLQEQAENMLRGEASPIPQLRQQMRKETEGASTRFKDACAQEAAKAKAGLKEEMMKAVTALTNAAADANAGLWESSKAIKHDLTFKGEKVRNHLAEISSASEEGFKNYTQVLVKGAQEEVREGLRVIAARSAQDFSGQLQKAAEGQLESFGPQLQRQAEDAAVLCRGSLESVVREARAETQIQVAGLSREALEGFSVELRSLSEKFRGELRSAVQELSTTATEELQSHLRKVGEEEQRAALSRIQVEGKAAGDRVVAEIKDRASESSAAGARLITETKERTETAARQASDAVYKQIGVATVVLKDWGDQAAARLEAQFRQFMAAFEKQVQELANQSLEANRLQAEATTQETRKRLEQATRILRGEPAEADQKNPPTGEPGSSSR